MARMFKRFSPRIFLTVLAKASLSKLILLSMVELVISSVAVFFESVAFCFAFLIPRCGRTGAPSSDLETEIAMIQLHRPDSRSQSTHPGNSTPSKPETWFKKSFSAPERAEGSLDSPIFVPIFPYRSSSILSRSAGFTSNQVSSKNERISTTFKDKFKQRLAYRRTEVCPAVSSLLRRTVN